MLRDVGCMQDILYANSCKYKTRITNIIRGFILEFKIFFFRNDFILYTIIITIIYIIIFYTIICFMLNYSTLNSIIVCKLYSLQKFIPASSKII